MTGASADSADRALSDARENIARAESIAFVASEFAMSCSERHRTDVSMFEHLHHLADAMADYIAAVGRALDRLEQLALSKGVES